MTQSQCRACVSQNVVPILDLGLMPPSRRFLTAELACQSEPVQPLRLLRCDSCGLLQLDAPRPADSIPVRLFQNPVTLPLSIERRPMRANQAVLAFAPRDAEKNRAFQDLAVKVTSFSGIEELRDQPLRSAQLILGLDALSAADDPREFLIGIQHALAVDGVAMIDVPDLHALHHRLSLDAVCHEVRCYYSVGQVLNLMREHGLELVNVEPLVDGSSQLRLTVQHRDGRIPAAPSIAEAIERERLAELDHARAWADFTQLLEMSRDLLMSELDEWLNRGKLITGWMRAGRGMTFLAYCGIDSLRMSYLVDEIPALHGLLTPGHRIPIVSPERLERESPDVVLLLGQDWDPTRECALTEHWRRGGRVLLPLPKPHAADLYLPASNRLNGGNGRDTIVPGLSFSEFA
jgi:hypothetical protein